MGRAPTRLYLVVNDANDPPAGTHFAIYYQPVPFVQSKKEEFDITRSQVMRFVSITIPNELINDSVQALGYFGKFHVVDLTGGNLASKQALAFKKRTGDIADLNKRLAALETQMDVRGIPIPEKDLVGDGNQPEAGRSARSAQDVVIGATEFLNEIDQSLGPNILFERTTISEIARLTEYKIVINEAQALIPATEESQRDEEQRVKPRSPRQASSSFSDEEENYGIVSDRISSYICGVVPLAQKANFRMAIQRITRGSNAYVRFADIPEPIRDPVSNELVSKSVFCIVTIGQQLYRRITKYCQTSGATVYNLPPVRDVNTNREELARIDSEIRDKQAALTNTSQNIVRILTDIATPRRPPSSTPFQTPIAPLRYWQQQLYREQLIINTLMCCDYHSTLVVLSGWVPERDLNELENCLAEACIGQGTRSAIDRNAIPPPGFETPPTYIPTNKLTSAFQGIVNTYGMPRYQEFNPALFTIVTFPFLFGVMYADMGHGALVALFGLALILMEKKLGQQKLGELMQMLYGGRYMLFLMGCFAVYNGIIYNDCMSLTTNLYGTNFSDPVDPEQDPHKVWNGKVYPVGIDPGWYFAKNQLQFFNSLKMKLAVFLGVIHMVFGIFISLCNHIYFKDTLAIFFEFLPRLLFMLCTFGYMVAIIIIKWSQNWSFDGADPPNLIQTMIDMVLKPGTVDESKQLFEGQGAVQVAFLLIAFFCVIWMWCPKPIIEHYKSVGKCGFLGCCHSPADDEYARFLEASRAHEDLLQHVDQLVPAPLSHGPAESGLPEMPIVAQAPVPVAKHGEHGEHAHTMGDRLIHQSIHTIEFVLGAVSNTASYLRLWALSLAHAQLAEVFWSKMIMEYGVTKNGVLAWVGSWVWMVATFAVLLCMDSLECFLHALRLHWVEFQNKFYGADGHAFKPFSFGAAPDN